jgi:hypothetical protein
MSMAISPGGAKDDRLRNVSFAPPGLVLKIIPSPTTRVVGYDLTPLRG